MKQKQSRSSLENADSARVRMLKCTAVADTAQYELKLHSVTAGQTTAAMTGSSERSVVFSSTPMYQSCCLSFTVNNTGLTSLSYEWALSSLKSPLAPPAKQRRGSSTPAPQPPCPFAIELDAGTIAAGIAQVGVIAFCTLV